MIRIAITAALEAIAAPLPLGSVAFEREPDANGERMIWLEPSVLSSLCKSGRSPKLAEDVKPGVRQSVLDDLVQDRREFGRREGAQSLSANVAELTEAHQQCGRRGVIRRVQDDDGIVLPLRPVDLLDRATGFFCSSLEGVSTFGGVFDVLNALVGEIA